MNGTNGQTRLQLLFVYILSTFSSSLIDWGILVVFPLSRLLLHHIVRAVLQVWRDDMYATTKLMKVEENHFRLTWLTNVSGMFSRDVTVKQMMRQDARQLQVSGQRTRKL